MANLTETSAWTTGVRRLDITTPAKGYDPDNPGDGIGAANYQGSDLANRTLYLKNVLDATIEDVEDLLSDDGADHVGYGEGVTVKYALDALNEGQAAGVIGYATRALLEADLAHDAGTIAYVTNDAAGSNNGVYIKVGGSGSGSWTQSSYDRVAEVEDRVATLEEQFNLDEQTIGLPPEDGYDVVAGYTYAISTPATVSGTLSEFRCYARTVGLLGLKVLRDNGDDTVTVLQSVSVTIPSTGLVTLVDGINFSDIVVPAGGYLGVSHFADEAVLSYGDGSSGNYYTFDDNVSGTVEKGAESTNPLLWEYDLTHVDVTIPSIVNDIDTLSSELDAIDDRVTDVEELLEIEPQVIGLTPGVGGGPASDGYTFIHAERVAVESKLTEFRCYASTTGAMKLIILQDNDDGTATVLDTVELTLAETGLQVFTDGVDFNDVVVPAGGLIGTYHDSGGQINYDTGEGIYYAITGEASGTEAIGAANQADLLWQFTLAPTALIAEEEDDSNEHKTLLEAVSAFGSLPSGWENSGSTWTFGSGKASSGTAGLGNQLRSGWHCGIDRRVARWEFEITHATTTINFVSYPSEVALLGSIVRLDSSTNKCEILETYTGSNSPSALASESLGFSLATGERYVIEIECEDQTLSVRLWNKSGYEYFETSRVPATWGDQGQMQGQHGVSVTAGSADIYSFSNYAVAAQNCRIYTVGDSIMAGYPVDDEEKYINLLRAILGEKQVVNSGVGGAIFTGGFARMQRELKYLRPKYIFIALGNNSGGESTLFSMVEWAKLKCEKVFVATVPTNATTTAVVNALDSSVGKIAFDLALTESGAGSTFLAAYDSGDHLHPNAAGMEQMLRRMMLDASEIFR